MVGVGVDVGVDVGGGGVEVGVEVEVGVGVGGVGVFVGKRTIVGSAASWPHPTSKAPIIRRNRIEVVTLAKLIRQPLFITQGVNGVQARRSQGRIQAEDDPNYQGESRSQHDRVCRDHSHQILREPRYPLR